MLRNWVARWRNGMFQPSWSPVIDASRLITVLQAFRSCKDELISGHMIRGVNQVHPAPQKSQANSLEKQRDERKVGRMAKGRISMHLHAHSIRFICAMLTSPEQILEGSRSAAELPHARSRSRGLRRGIRPSDHLRSGQLSCALEYSSIPAIKCI
ncbi:hypothetical protein P154DRAFT_520058 [Amniculicola lignicola CBS 123094]|uniref:Uncharacterized protein n=1 Tax=Amniculicola lignicola CBS 123094 TaxID=1392246 RepID=A0A6A5WPI9_9PLEO|nr:hypothetical protein P154DRAFT_520058 [Amniculicola lignicola CBS 123094]